MDQVSIFFFLAALCSLWDISVPQPGMELVPQAVQVRVLTTAPSGKPQVSTSYTLSLHNVTSHLNPNKRKSLPVILHPFSC